MTIKEPKHLMSVEKITHLGYGELFKVSDRYYARCSPVGIAPVTEDRTVPAFSLSSGTIEWFRESTMVGVLSDAEFYPYGVEEE